MFIDGGGSLRQMDLYGMARNQNVVDKHNGARPRCAAYLLRAGYPDFLRPDFSSTAGKQLAVDCGSHHSHHQRISCLSTCWHKRSVYSAFSGRGLSRYVEHDAAAHNPDADCAVLAVVDGQKTGREKDFSFR